MKIFFVLLSFLIVLESSLASEKLKNHAQNGEIILAGKLNASTLPNTLALRFHTKNQETILVQGLSTDDALKYDGVIVVIDGLLKEDLRQYQIVAKRIRKATMKEINAVTVTAF